MELRGIDVSKHQGKIDWGKIEADFAILRVGYSKYNGGIVEDDYFRYNAEECERLGIPYGVYVYSYNRSVSAAIDTAEDVVQLLEGRKITYPVYYDIEEVGNSKNLNANMCNAFCEYIRQAGYTPGVYSYYAFFKNFIDMGILRPVDKWIADYRGKRPGDIEHEIWQYTGSGNIDGITTKVDLNICYKDYVGAEEKGDSEIAKLIQELKEVIERYDHV